MPRMSKAAIRSTWATDSRDDPTDPESAFRPTLVARAKKRVVVPAIGDDAYSGDTRHYKVVGDAKLGDSYDDYAVAFNGRAYTCSCREHGGGEYRKSICSHVLAVMLYRKSKGTGMVDVERSGGPGTESGVPVVGPSPVPDPTPDRPRFTISISRAPGTPAPEGRDDQEEEADSHTHIATEQEGGGKVLDFKRPPAQELAPPPPSLDPEPWDVKAMLKEGGQARQIALEIMRGERDEWGDPIEIQGDYEDTIVHSITPDPTHADWGDPPLPEWVTSFRDHQIAAVDEVMGQFDSGKRVVFLDAPTGAGKTLIAEMVRRKMGVNGLYVCTTKTLQDQFLRDYPYAKVLKGRSNYPTHDRPEEFGDVDRWGTPALSAAECTKAMRTTPACSGCDPEQEPEDRFHCDWCHPVSACPYSIAKGAALAAPVAVLNTAYLLAEANSAGSFSGYELVVVDEADLLEGELMNTVEVRVSNRMKADLGLNEPEKKTVESAWVEWVTNEAIPKVERAVKKARGGGGVQGDLLTGKAGPDPRRVREENKWNRLLGKLKVLEKGLGNGGWIYGGYDEGEIVFRPIRVDGIAEEWLWSHGERWLVMSATIISAEEMVESLGVQ